MAKQQTQHHASDFSSHSHMHTLFLPLSLSFSLCLSLSLSLSLSLCLSLSLSLSFSFSVCNLLRFTKAPRFTPSRKPHPLPYCVITGWPVPSAAPCFRKPWMEPLVMWHLDPSHMRKRRKRTRARERERERVCICVYRCVMGRGAKMAFASHSIAPSELCVNWHMTITEWLRTVRVSCR